MNKKRLNTLAKYLRTVPPEKFDMEVWSCGTTACAVGHAADIPEFKKAGFKITEACNYVNAYPAYGWDTGWPAVEAFFDLNEEEASFLFSPDDYSFDTDTPNEVADKIEKFIAEGGVKWE